jgi:hypothetical protein
MLSCLLNLILGCWLRGRGEFGIGGNEDTQPFRLARAEPVYQVVQVVVVVSRGHRNSLRFAYRGCRDRQLELAISRGVFLEELANPGAAELPVTELLRDLVLATAPPAAAAVARSADGTQRDVG